MPINRRRFLYNSALFGFSQYLITEPVLALEKNIRLDTALNSFSLGKPILIDSRIKITINEHIENGFSVPIGIDCQAFSNSDRIKEFALFSSGNPFSKIAQFYFPSPSIPPSINTRIRLAQDQHIIVLARSETGKIYRAEKSVRVDLGGCSV